jgi:hypothetical protein
VAVVEEEGRAEGEDGLRWDKKHDQINFSARS